MMVISEILLQDPSKVLIVDDDDMVETISAYGSDEPLDITVLPWRTWKDRDFLCPRQNITPFSPTRPARLRCFL
jgi:hypothetical protein